MKKIMITLAVILTVAIFTGNAQTQINDKFEGGSALDWNEYSTKTGKALIQEGYLLLKSSEKESMSWTFAEIPINYDFDFTIETDIEIPKLNEEEGFGIVIDRDENLRSCWFIFREDQLICEIATTTECFTRDKEIIKLKGGKNITVHLKLKRINGKYEIYVNNMKAYVLHRAMHSRIFGYCADEEIKVKQITISQDIREESM